MAGWGKRDLEARNPAISALSSASPNSATQPDSTLPSWPFIYMSRNTRRYQNRRRRERRASQGVAAEPVVLPTATTSVEGAPVSPEVVAESHEAQANSRARERGQRDPYSSLALSPLLRPTSAPAPAPLCCCFCFLFLFIFI